MLTCKLIFFLFLFWRKSRLHSVRELYAHLCRGLEAKSQFSFTASVLQCYECVLNPSLWNLNSTMQPLLLLINLIGIDEVHIKHPEFLIIFRVWWLVQEHCYCVRKFSRMNCTNTYMLIACIWLQPTEIKAHYNFKKKTNQLRHILIYKNIFITSSIFPRIICC